MSTRTRLTVRYAETDMMGIVHHSRYYQWFEAARTDFIKQTGMTYSQMERSGILMPIVETEAKYIKGVKYEDEVAVVTKLKKLSAAKCEFGYEVYRLPDEELCAFGRTLQGFVDRDFKPINMKKKFPELWDKLAALIEE